MYEFNSIENYNIDFDLIFNDAYKNWLTEIEGMNLNSSVVLKDKNIYGILLMAFNKCIFYRYYNDYYFPFIFKLDEECNIISFKGLNNTEYSNFPNKNIVVIRNNTTGYEYGLNYIDGYVKYFIHNLHNDHLITYFYKQSQVLNEHKKNIILKDYLNEPDGFCYQESQKAIGSYGYLKTFVNGGYINYLKAISTETFGPIEFFNKLHDLKLKDYPELVCYARIYKIRGEYYMPTKPYINLISKNKYDKIIQNADESNKVPIEIIDFYNGNHVIYNKYQILLNEYINNQKSLELIKKI